MEIRNLATTPLSDIVQCITEAFADYFVQLPADVAYWENRFKGARVDYSLSFGMFAGNKLEGFIINGIDEENGIRTAFNTGTGVTKAARGYKVVDHLYAHALPLLQAAGVRRCSLEVIGQNDRAIHVYERIGFRITKTLECFKGSLLPAQEKARAEAVPFESIAAAVTAADPYYSWDHTSNAIKASGATYTCYKAKDNAGAETGYFIINTASGQLAQLEGKTDADIPAVLAAAATIAPVVKINNVNRDRTAMLQALTNAGLDNFITQHEMQLDLS